MSERTTINIDMIEQSEHAESLKSDAARSIKTELSESVLNGNYMFCIFFTTRSYVGVLCSITNKISKFQKESPA